MTTFDEREQAFENKFKHDEELRFKVYTRRAKLLGLWAAHQMGLSQVEADSYARQVVSVDFEEAGHDDIVRKVHGDLSAKGVNVSKHKVEREAERLLSEAKTQIMTA
ncbi:MAG TPA: DUF1476 domain-containing protein [Azospirillaceae bacterium]|nr:DUF1476 domain-containing protein [Azospirillaceae bacterium]